MLKEFKEFALTGNLLDIAVGFVMGAAFNKFIGAFTSGIVSPIIGMIFQTEDLHNMKHVLREAVPEKLDAAGNVIQAAVTENAILYGEFLAAFIDFLILAFVMFLIVRWVNKKRKQEAEAPAAPSTEEVLLTEIRDLLQK